LIAEGIRNKVRIQGRKIRLNTQKTVDELKEESKDNRRIQKWKKNPKMKKFQR
jgi:hypothetical protein